MSFDEAIGRVKSALLSLNTVISTPDLLPICLVLPLVESIHVKFCNQGIMPRKCAQFIMDHKCPMLNKNFNHYKPERNMDPFYDKTAGWNYVKSIYKNHNNYPLFMLRVNMVSKLLSMFFKNILHILTFLLIVYIGYIGYLL